MVLGLVGALLFMVLGLVVFFCFWFLGVSFEVGSFLGGSLDSDFCFLFDGLSVLFLFMLVVCGGVALGYCVHYFGSYSSVVGLYSLIVFFLLVMSFLVSSDGLILSLVFWEYLGLVSFLLILYYSNMVSFRASVITLVSSRVGDVGLFVVFCWFYGFYDFSFWFLVLSVLFVVMTKSASFPLVSWLIEAMRAPTPVSSLVHSSTLVAAGVWFLLRYNWVYYSGVSWFFFVISLITVFVSGFCASSSVDLKKIVAFSTCNNISWCVLYFIVGDVVLSCFQLLTHGVCKCFLFMVVGDLMNSSFSGQSCLGVYSSSYLGYYGFFVRFLLISSLCGLPFLGVFFTKHYFFSCCLSVFGVVYVLCLFGGFAVTYFYSFRFLAMFVLNKCGLGLCYVRDFLVVGCLAVLGSLINCSVYGLLEEVSMVGGLLGLFFFFFQLVFSVLGAVSYVVSWCGGFSWLSYYLFGCDDLVLCFYSLWGKLCNVVFVVLFRWECFFLKLFMDSRVYYCQKFFGLFVGVGWLVVGSVITVCIFFYFF
uniref:NADH:ubiquinone reductase (H(+)-translocating) n=1 Tax=Prosthogonimus cuneatus TaxID=232414 RepID=A0A7L7S435_9TREM|nr:NADH dehydrogenase subunit 5 [Prosthogonimus cuneatus]QNU39799.1 NADH dehydrogenase subunit 5 [Prosthogonimus cuneatus]